MIKKVFEKTNIGGIEVNNRLVRSACGSGVATVDGYVTDNVIEWHRDIAEGQVGLIITGMMGITDDGNFPAKVLRIHDDSFIEGLSKVTNIVHNNKSKIISQIGHHGALLFSETKTQPIGPSEVEDFISGIKAKEMTKNDIKNMISEFVKAAIRSKKAGFDGVQVHAAHGFLLNKFLSPYYNRRNDEYGGSIENRTRIIVEIFNGIKEECGKDFPIFLKINSSDFLKNNEGFTFEECKEACKILAEAGYDAIEISGGIAGGEVGPARPKIKTKEDEAYQREYAQSIAEEIDTPVILVGGIKSLEVAEEILQETKIQAISMARALTMEPKLIKKWIEEESEKSKCISCNKCFGTEGELCIFNRKN